MKVITRSLVAMAFVVGATACASTAGTPRTARPIDGDFFDRATIQESGAKTAWEALQRLAFSLHVRDDGAGRALGVRRSNPSVLAGTRATLVVVDDMRLQGLQVLHDLPTSQIVSIHVMPVTRALTEFGPAGWNGAIVVKMRPDARR